ncbi:MAG: hypothetical protein WCP09_02555 [Candidatus Taylorbacteria bacterium]
MKIISKSIIIIPLLALSLYISQANAVRAQSNDVEQLEVTSCFDHYKFGGVEVSFISSPSERFSAGTKLDFSGNIINTNDYPILDVMIYAKIFKRNTVNSQDDQVDQFIVMDGFNLKALDKRSVHFTWSIPAYALSGDYTLKTYVISSQRFNHSGLSFTEDVSASMMSFGVYGERKGILNFDKDKVYVNDAKFNFAAFIPQVDRYKPIDVKALISNRSSNDESAIITYKLYKWDGIRPENLVSSSEEIRTIKANSDLDVFYKIEDNSTSVYYLTIEARYKDTKSILNVRVARNGADVPRINSVGVSKYPIDVNTTIFSCVHNTGQTTEIDGYHMGIELSNEYGDTLYQGEYRGKISSAVMGLENVLSGVKEPLGNFDIQVMLYDKDDVVIDKVVLIYDCSIIDPTKCSSSSTLILNYIGHNLLVSFIIMALFIILTMTIITTRHKKIQHNHPTLTMLLLGGILFGSAYVNIPYFVEAEEVKQNIFLPNPGVGDISYLSNFMRSSGTNSATMNTGFFGGASGYSQMYLTVNTYYGINIYKKSSYLGMYEKIGSDAIVKVGEFIKIESWNIGASGSLANNVSWNGSGSAADTPYVYWVLRDYQKPYDNTGCNENDYVFKTTYPNHPGRKYRFYYPVTITIPSFNTSGTSARETSVGTNEWMVTDAGKIDFTATIGATKAHPYIASEFDICEIQNQAITDGVNHIVIDGHTFNFTLTAVPPTPANQAPSIPTASVTSSCADSTGSSPITFIISATDPESNRVKYSIDYGDGGGWTSTGMFYDSGQPVTYSKNYASPGTKQISIKAEDTNGSVSSVLTVTSNVLANCNLLNATCSLNPPSGALSSDGGSVRFTETANTDTSKYVYQWNNSTLSNQPNNLSLVYPQNTTNKAIVSPGPELILTRKSDLVSMRIQCGSVTTALNNTLSCGSLTVSPQSIPVNGTVYISWKSTSNASSCLLNTVSVATSSGNLSDNPSQNTTYSLQCTNSNTIPTSCSSNSQIVIITRPANSGKVKLLISRSNATTLSVTDLTDATLGNTYYTSSNKFLSVRLGESFKLQTNIGPDFRSCSNSISKSLTPSANEWSGMTSTSTSYSKTLATDSNTELGTYIFRISCIDDVGTIASSSVKLNITNTVLNEL